MCDVDGRAAFWNGVSPRLRRVGLRCWLWLGIAGLALAVATAIGSLSGIVVPFVIALVLATLLVPVVDFLAARGLGRLVSSLMVILLMLTLAVAALLVVASGIFEQADAMTAQVRRGVAALATALEQWQFSGDTVRSLGEKALANLPTVASGAANFFTSGLSGTFAFFIGSFSALLLLYYLLLDWKGVTGWMAGNLGLPRDLGESLIADATGAVREYFLALTLSSVVVSVIIGGTIYLLGLPLALTVGLVTMLTSYVPYLGAIVAGAFACLVALGSGDLGKAVLVLAVVLVVQNVVQTVIQNKLASSRLQMHPIVTFTTVIGGGILLGILGAALANPVTATVLIFRKHLAARETADEGETG